MNPLAETAVRSSHRPPPARAVQVNSGCLEIDSRFTHLIESEGSVALVGCEDSVVLEGSGVADLLRAVDGSRSAYEVAEVLASDYRPEVVHYALMRLEKAGVLHTLQSPRASPTEPPLDPLADRLRSLWRSRGNASVRPVPCADGVAGPRLLLTDDYLHPDLGRRVRCVMDRNPSATSVLLVRVGPDSVWVGPQISPGHACVACLQERLRLNLTARAVLHAAPHSTTGVGVERVGGAIPDGVFGAASTLLMELARQGDVGRWLWRRSLDDSAADTHVVPRLPQCPQCGRQPTSASVAPLTVRSRPLRRGSSGGYRIRVPQDTWARYEDLVSPLTGVVRQINKIEVSDTDLVHVYTASHAGHYRPRGVRDIKDDARDPSGGKGATDLDARVSALCESLERVSALHRGSEPFRTARLSDLGPSAVAHNQIQLFSEAQFEQRVPWNDVQSGHFQWVPERYTDEVVPWSEVTSLTSHEIRWVPSSLLYLGHAADEARFGKGDSNGLAGGNCLEEAILQGLLELVERDAVAMWWYNRLRMPALDLDSTSDGYVARVREYYRRTGRALWVLDLTNDIDIPVFAAIAGFESAERPDLIMGFGAHLDPGIALSRALTELNQMLPTVLRSPEQRRRQLLPDFADVIDWWDTADLAGHPYLVPNAETCRSIDRYARGEDRDLLVVLEEAVGMVAATGCDVLVHDLTRADIGFSVAKVLAPGLRHFWRRTAPGRLYDVPVELGWLESPTTEPELNPVSMFL